MMEIEYSEMFTKAMRNLSRAVVSPGLSAADRKTG
jgi:hypothetical protein